jgi:hypothetical protein
MKNLLLSSLLLVSTLFSVSGQKMEFFGQINEEKITPAINFAASKNFSDKFGLTFFSLISEAGWAEVNFGPTFSPTTNSCFSISAGIETGGNKFRIATSAFIAFKSEIHFLLVAEKGQGDDNYWYHSQIMKSWKKISAGIMARRFNGVGPRMEIKMTKDFTLWGAPLYDFEDGKIKGVVSLAINFK